MGHSDTPIYVSFSKLYQREIGVNSMFILFAFFRQPLLSCFPTKKKEKTTKVRNKQKNVAVVHMFVKQRQRCWHTESLVWVARVRSQAWLLLSSRVKYSQKIAYCQAFMNTSIHSNCINFIRQLFDLGICYVNRVITYSSKQIFVFLQSNFFFCLK